MSVADPVIDYLDTANKLIYLLSGVRSYHPVDDIYKEIRHLRSTTDTLQQYFNPVSGGGSVPKGGGKFTPRYAVFNGGWRLVPEDVDHVLDVTGEQLTAEGGSGSACFDFTLLSAGTTVVVNYEPPAAEIIQIGGDDLILMRKILQNRTHTNPTTGTITVFDDDDITELVSASIYEDVGGSTPYNADSTRIDRRDRLE